MIARLLFGGGGGLRSTLLKLERMEHAEDVRNMPGRSRKSPMRLTMNAFIPAVVANFLSK